MAMTKKEKDAFFAEVKKRGNITKGEVFTPGSLVRGVAKVAAKVAGKQTVKGAVKAETKANARGLKAAQKPTNKTGTKADRADRARLQGNANVIKNADPARANRTRGGSLAAMKAYGGQGVATAKLTPKQAALRAEINKELNPTRKAKDLASKKKGNK